MFQQKRCWALLLLCRQARTKSRGSQKPEIVEIVKPPPEPKHPRDIIAKHKKNAETKSDEDTNINSYSVYPEDDLKYTQYKVMDEQIFAK